jgi:two-component system, NtrC family, sensor histidine kinase HydH
MDPELVQVVQIAWSPDRRLTAAEGACEEVLGKRSERLIGLPLHEALGISQEVARDLDVKARAADGSTTEFLTVGSGQRRTVLRIVIRVRGAEARGAAMDLREVLTGAPPVQIAKLASSLAHEVRNPLSSVKMAVQTVARSPSLSDRDQRRLAIANREIRTLERMLWLLSEYGREGTAALEPVPLRLLVQEAASLVEPELLERKLQVEIDDLSSVRVRADAASLRRVLSQLLLNVSPAYEEGSILPVKIFRTEDGSALTLRDPSSTIRPEERSSLFEPFGSMLARSAGLSLAALHQVMRSLGGSISAQADAEPGTLYTLRFPS